MKVIPSQPALVQEISRTREEMEIINKDSREIAKLANEISKFIGAKVLYTRFYDEGGVEISSGKLANVSTYLSPSSSHKSMSKKYREEAVKTWEERTIREHKERFSQELPTVVFLTWLRPHLDGYSPVSSASVLGGGFIMKRLANDVELPFA